MTSQPHQSSSFTMQHHHMTSSQHQLQGHTIQHQMSSPSALCTLTSSSPPQYNHIEHNLRPNFSNDPYGRINTRITMPLSPPLAPPTTVISPAHGATDYERLNHTPITSLPNHTPITSVSNHTPITSILPIAEQCNYVTVQHVHEEEEEEISPIYSNVQLVKGEEEEEEQEDTPPPLPPRVVKRESV